MKLAVCLLAARDKSITTDAVFNAVSRRNDPSHWGFPGGKVDPGETTLQAVIREVFEELGITLVPEQLMPVYSGVCHGAGPDDTYLVTTYLLRDTASVQWRQMTVEQGLIQGWKTMAELCDQSKSPFADYNKAVFEVYHQF